jgi:hypothetical protein
MKTAALRPEPSQSSGFFCLAFPVSISCTNDFKRSI